MYPPSGGTYLPNLDCSWVISGHSGLFTSVAITFSTEQCCDFVRIYAGSSFSGALVSSMSGRGLRVVAAASRGADLTIRYGLSAAV